MGSLTDRARDLRRNSTEIERKLWQLLRSRQLASAKFRRQQPIDCFIADFVSFAHRIVIECDGGQHSGNQKDKRRDNWFASQGFRTLRFWNNDVLSNPEGVIAEIRAALRAAPLTPTLSHKGRG